MKKFFKGFIVTTGVVAVIIGALAVILDYIVSHEDGTNINWGDYNF